MKLAPLPLAFLLVATPLAAADLAQISSRGTLKVLVSADEQPEMFNFGAGEPGFERELVEGFARLQRVKLEVVRVANWEDIIPSLVRGDGDVITGIIDTEARRKQVAFSAEVLPATHVAVNRKPKPPIATLDALKAERVAVVAGTTWEQEALGAGVPASKLDRLGETGDVLGALRSGKSGAAVMSVSDFTLAVRRDRELQGGMFVGARGSAAFALRKQDAELARAMNEYLDGIRKTGSWSRLIVKYFGEDALSVLGRKK